MNEEFAKAPIAEVLPGIEIGNLPTGCVAMEVCCTIKALDAEGEVQTFVRCSEGINDFEIMGMLLGELDRRRYHKASTFEAQDPDED